MFLQIDWLGDFSQLDVYHHLGLYRILPYNRKFRGIKETKE